MTICVALITGQIDTGCTILVVNVAREIPIQLAILASDARVRCLGNKALARAVRILEKKREVAASRIPVSFEERVAAAGKGSNFGMVEAGKVIVMATDYDGGRIDIAGVESVGRLSADKYSETEGQEADTSHQDED